MPKSNASVWNAAQLSARVNSALAFESHGGTADWSSIAAQALRAGPAALIRFGRDSRILERVLSRIRADMKSSLEGLFDRHRVLRFLVVGFLNTILAYAVYTACIFIGTGVPWASLVSLVAGIVVGFIAQGKFVFRSGEGSFLKFIMVWVSLYFVFVGLVLALERIGINNYFGGAIATLVNVVLSYVLQSRFVFRPHPGP
jgi:putative flippase GtrA